MRQRTSVLAFLATMIFGSARLLGAEDPSFSKDLTATIALQGLPCDKVVDAKRNGDSDYIASCQDGNRYHVFVNAEGRVVAQKQ